MLIETISSGIHRMWRKIGFIKVPKTGLDWMSSHCQLPTVLVLTSTSVRVFFASRNYEQRSHIGFVELSIVNDSVEVNEVSKEPVLSPGSIGFFDEHGVFPSCLVQDKGIFYLFYIGWNQGKESPLFYSNIGLATSRDGINFERFSRAPFIGRSDCDPCLVTSPFVFKDGNKWHMTYVSGFKWERSPATGLLQSYYHIKYAESEDLMQWKREGKIAIDLNPGESNVARSTVVKEGEIYRMWFSYVRSDIGKYRIGYAYSQDGRNWNRNDDMAVIGIDDDWASEMICYPQVFELSGRMYMLYNGNSFGEMGFGIAIWEA